MVLKGFFILVVAKLFSFSWWSLNISVEKTADRVTIKNGGQTLYNQAFSDNDANCRKATTQVKTQVWNYAGSLHLGVFDNSYAR